jgi:hypothetical protein
LGEAREEDNNFDTDSAVEDGSEATATTRVIGRVALPAWRFSKRGAFLDRALLDAGAITAPFNTSVAVLQHTGGMGLELAMRQSAQTAESLPARDAL